jgi:alkylhydroperoxidase family enzyme
MDHQLTLMCERLIQVLLDPPQADVAGAPADEAVEQVRNWNRDERITSSQRAALAFVEQFVFDVTGIADEHVARLAESMSPGEIYHFVRWLQAAEARQRAHLLLRHHAGRRFE